jgi:HB1, ASXL, restriction endonuclease HTH domain
MVRELAAALDANRDEIERALAVTESELAGLRQRERELEVLIARARAALGLTPVVNSTREEPRMTLHVALERILRENGNRWMTVRELADAVNETGFYKKRDGSPVEANQIHARTKNYSALFEKDRGRVRLHELMKEGGSGNV